MRRILFLALLGSLVGCNGSSGTPLPAGVVALESFMRLQFGQIGTGLAGFLGVLPLLLDPEAAAMEGVVFEPDMSMGAPPNAYLFDVPLDIDADGMPDSTASGSAVLSGDLSTFGPGFSATVDGLISVNGGQGTLEVSLVITFTANGVEISGGGEFLDDLSGNEGGFSIDPATPVLLRAPSGNGTGNLCNLDAEGPIHITVGPQSAMTTQLQQGGLPPGFFQAIWNFFFGSKQVRVTDATYADPVMGTAAVPDSTVTLPACGASSLEAWVGNWNFDWYCTPTGTGPGGTVIDSGNSAISITLTGPNSVRIVDNALIYDATAVPGSPRVLRGTFQDTDGGGTYNENFTWMLSADGTTWTQTSSYLYFSGMAAGLGGDCYGTATR